MTVDSAFTFISILVSIGIVQSSLESIILFVKFPALLNHPLDKGIIKSTVAKQLHYFYNAPFVWVLSISKLLIGFWLLITSILGDIQFLPALLLLVIDLVGFSRWRFFPSSEIPIQRVILISISLQAYFNQASISSNILYIISGFLCLAYFASGYKKVLDSNWKDGSTITHFIKDKHIPSQLWKWIGFLIIIFECFFFIGIVNTNLAVLFIGVGLLFHLYLYLKHQLNFFFWTFIAAYPAFYYTAQQINSIILEYIT